MPENNNNRLKEKVLEGVYGKKEIKKEEKNRFLGQYKERVIKYLTYEQVMEEGTYEEIEAAIRDPRACKLIIDREVDLAYAHDYIKLARKENLNFKRVDSPDFRGDVALVVVSDGVVDVENKQLVNG